MTLLAPLWLALAGVASAVVVALHLITTQRPPAEPLPTARFVPAGEARAAARASRPSDLLLLLLRVIALLLLGTAAARPVLTTPGAPLARVIVVDRSRSAGADVLDSARAYWRAGDAVVVFDSSARIVTAPSQDSLRALPVVGARGSLSAALAAARRAGAALATRADSAELVLITSAARDAADAATAGLAASWPGRHRVVVTAAPAPVVARVELAGARADDPLAAALSLVPLPRTSSARVILRRDAVTDGDRAAANAGAALVIWPRTVRGTARPRGIEADGATFVAELAGDSAPDGGTVVARWSDGSAAAVERVVGSGCERTVGVGLPDRGDAALSEPFVRVLSRLVAPCAAAPRAVTDTALVRTLRADGPAATAAALRDPASQEAPLALWCAVAALAALLVEWAVRDRALGSVRL
jgi:hypothetical protein